ncbi:MAG: recombinase family protein [Clostridiales bacterium]|nr:recombinase family protein [Clostridiales bacterium]
MADKMWNVAAYTRLSRDDGDKAESDSIGSQKEIIRAFVRDRDDMVIVKEYVDDGYSGVNFDRPDFQQMLADIKAKRINCVICKDLSRFARNYIDSGRYLEKIFPFMGVRFIANAVIFCLELAIRSLPFLD